MNFITGFGAAFGNMLARKEYDLARKNLGVYELIIFDLTAVIYTTTGLMIVPFALIYTKNIVDVDYARPLFALIATVAGAFSCFRIPYQTIVEAAGHFRQTRNGALIEAVINIGISLAAVVRFGLVGVAIGTLVAMVFRSVQYAVYLSRHVIKRNILIFWGHVLINVLIAVMTAVLSGFFLSFEITGYVDWGVKAALIAMISVIMTGITNLIFYRKDFMYFLEKIRGMVKGSKKRK